LSIDKLVGDQYLLIFFSSLSTLFGALLVEGLRRRMFSTVPAWVSPFCVLAVAFVNPVLHLVTSPAQYQVAIAGGQAFLLGGVMFSFEALFAAHSPRRKRRWFVLAGLSFACSMASRINLAGAAAFVALLTLLTVERPSLARSRAMLADAACVGALPVLSLFGLLLYNKLRFGSWLEFGQTEQLTYFKLSLAKRYVVPNLFAYSLTPFEATCEFPYALQNWLHGPKGIAWRSLPEDYVVEPVAGFLLTSPITWLFLVPLVLAIRHAFQVERVAWRYYLYSSLSFLSMAALGGATILFVRASTMRYLDDFIHGLVLLGVLGGFSLIAMQRSKLRRALVSVGVSALCTVTVVFGLLLGYQGYNEHFKLFNPALDAKLTKQLSLCELFAKHRD